jgi:hypothetical protein
MIVKFTLFGLIVLLMIVIASSYYVNKEGFDNISNGLSTDLHSAINTVQSNIPSTSMENSIAPPEAPPAIPVRNDIVPEVSISGSGYNAMNLQQRAELLKDIQKVVRNEVLASRSTTPIIQNVDKGDCSDSTAQGQDYSNNCHKDTEYRCPKNPDGTCPPIPDMTQYIKKDAIPCFGCSLDY